MRKFLLLFFLTVAVSAFGQTQDSSEITSTNDNKATAVFNQGDSISISHRGLITAMPGVSANPGPFPGYFFDSGKWQLYRPAAYATLTMDEINNMAKGGGCGEMTFTRLQDDNVIPENNDPISIIVWWPKSTNFNGDKVLGVAKVMGKSWMEPEEHYLGCVLKEAKKKTHTRRVAILAREVKEGVTKGRSIGGGAGYSRIINQASDNDPVAVATGGVFGTNRVRAEEKPEFYVLSMNDGSTELPLTPEPQKAQAPLPAPASAVVSQPTKPQEVVVRLVVEQPQPQLVPISKTITPAPIVEAVPEKCEALLPLVVNFDFDKYFIKDEYKPKIKESADWLASHPNCRVQVEGHTCKIGTYAYNENLGRNRSKSVYDLLLSYNSSLRDRIVEQFVSVGEDKPASEYFPENRRVILRIIGKASGK